VSALRHVRVRPAVLPLLVVAVAVFACALAVVLMAPRASQAQAGAMAPQRAEDAPSQAERARLMEEVSGRVMCPSCGTTLDNSDSPAADRMRDYIDERITDGWTADEIVNGLVVEYGGDQDILAAPPTDTRRGMLAWGVPALVALAALVGGALSVRRWRRASEPRPT
jgi:cytochrome c-type biogenesis protein CcmH/NrfF